MIGGIQQVRLPACVFDANVTRFAANPLLAKCVDAPDYCLQGMILHWTADGPLPMRMQGATDIYIHTIAAILGSLVAPVK